VGFNIVAAVFLYWLCRVPKHWSRKVKQAWKLCQWGQFSAYGYALS
jgi:hypothetical protein